MSELGKAFESGRPLGAPDPETELRDGESVSFRQDSKFLPKSGVFVYLLASTPDGNSVPFKFRINQFQLTRMAGNKASVRPGFYRKLRIMAQKEYDRLTAHQAREFISPRVAYDRLQTNAEMVSDMRVGPSLKNPEAQAFYIQIQNAEGTKVLVFTSEGGTITRAPWDDNVNIGPKLYERLFKIAKRELRRIGVAA